MVEAHTIPAIRSLDPLGGRYISGPGVTIAAAAPRELLSLRVHESGVGDVGSALGLDLPTRPKTSAGNDTLSALWLGPDEWLLVGLDDDADLIGTVEGAGVATQSAVDLSHQLVAILIDGEAAAAVLSACCPQDLRLTSFPVGACSRTIFAKAEIILWRRDETRLELVCRRSFADYVWALLADASRSPAV